MNNVTAERRRQMRAVRQLAIADAAIPDWVPGDADDPRLDAAIERRADEMTGTADDWCELFERAAASEKCREAVVAFFNEPMQSPRFAEIARRFRWALSDMADESAREELTHE